MNLTSILVFTVSALSVMSGLACFAGSSKNERKRTVWLFVKAICEAIWACSCILFLDLPADASPQEVVALRTCIYYGGALMTMALAMFCVRRTTLGKAVLGFLAIFIASFLTLLAVKPEVMFDGYNLSSQGNIIYLKDGPAYLIYALFFVLGVTSCLVSVMIHAKHARLKATKKGDYVLLAGLMTTGLISMVFDVILPYVGQYSLIWVGPLSLSVFMIALYFTMIKFRTVSLNSNWLKLLSGIVLVCGGVIAYMVIFYIIFTALFKIPNPSPAILVLNFLMVVIVLLLMPVLSELYAAARSMIAVGQVDIAYVVKKLNRLATKNVDLRDLAGFLADHLHFAYIGFIINGRLYGSKSLAVSSEELSQITHMKQTARELWQEPNKSVQKVLDELDLKAVAELRNAKGKTFGQMVVGKPLGKTSFERRDLIQLEMIINLVATVIDSEKHLRA